MTTIQSIVAGTVQEWSYNIKINACLSYKYINGPTNYISCQLDKFLIQLLRQWHLKTFENFSIYTKYEFCRTTINLRPRKQKNNGAKE